MRLVALYFAALGLLAVSGCGKSLHRQITGKWTIDDSNELFDLINDGDQASETSRKFVLEFDKAGVFRSTVSSSGYTQTKEGRWFFVEGQADLCKLKVSINSDNPGIEPDIVLTEIKFIDEETIELVPPNMDGIKQSIDKMIFRKIQ